MGKHLLSTGVCRGFSIPHVQRGLLPPRSCFCSGWLAAARAVFRWGVHHGRVQVNPFEGCVVEVPRQTTTRETGKAFTDDEALLILSAALRVEAHGAHTGPLCGDGFRGCSPTLAGARVRELTQLRAQDIEQRNCGHILRITPDAGPVKTRKARVVPIHSHLVEMGLME